MTSIPARTPDPWPSNGPIPLPTSRGMGICHGTGAPHGASSSSERHRPPARRAASPDQIDTRRSPPRTRMGATDRSFEASRTRTREGRSSTRAERHPRRTRRRGPRRLRPPGRLGAAARLVARPVPRPYRTRPRRTPTRGTGPPPAPPGPRAPATTHRGSATHGGSATATHRGSADGAAPSNRTPVRDGPCGRGLDNRQESVDATVDNRATTVDDPASGVDEWAKQGRSPNHHI